LDGGGVGRKGKRKDIRMMKSREKTDIDESFGGNNMNSRKV